MTTSSKAFLCAAIALTCLIAVGGINWISRLEYYFPAPSMRDSLRYLPTVSQLYFRYYPFFWVICGIVLLWGIILTWRRKTRLEDIAMLAAYAMLVTTAFAIFAAMAFYCANRGLVFNFQHLR